MAQDDISFSDLIASSIHDMKNSLNLQVSALEKIAMQSRDKGDSATFDDLGRVIYQANRMNLNLIELLSLYKLGKSIYPVDINEHSVAELIEEAVLQNQTMMDFKGIRVSIDCAPDLFWYLDRELVKGVLVNALNNAYLYTHDHTYSSPDTCAHNRRLHHGQSCAAQQCQQLLGRHQRQCVRPYQLD